MKYIICFLLVISIFVSCCACDNDTNNGDILNFYYCTTSEAFGTDNSVFAVEKREISCSPSDYILLIEEFLNGAKVKECRSPFPGGTTLEEFSLKDGYATIVLSPHMAQQSDADVIVCCACLCLTLFELPDFETIEISITERTINGEQKLVFTRNSFSLNDIAS